MWMIVFGFALTTLLLAWLLFGYVVWLRFAGDSQPVVKLRLPTDYPNISIVIPCLNEENLIADKYRNLVDGDYPTDRLEIVFADGGSKDGTLDRLHALAREDDRVRVVACPMGGKINQINHVLPGLTGDIVFITDVDGWLEKDALSWMAAEFQAKPNVAVVGAHTSPRGGLAVERCYWSAQNRVRLLESRVSHVSMVVACCYAFRRGLLKAFPADVIADDVYVAALANTQGRRTSYCAKAIVEELRTPHTLPEFFRHKYRKSNAVLREMLRFSHRLPEMDPHWKSILSTRIVQQLLLPWGTAMWLAMAAALANLGQIDAALIGAAILLVALLATRKATMSVEQPADAERFDVITLALAYFYTMGVLCVTALTYLSFRQSSCYARLTGEVRRMDRSAVEASSRSPADSSDETLPIPASPAALHGSSIG